MWLCSNMTVWQAAPESKVLGIHRTTAIQLSFPIAPAKYLGHVLRNYLKGSVSHLVRSWANAPSGTNKSWWSWSPMVGTVWMMGQCRRREDLTPTDELQALYLSDLERLVHWDSSTAQMKWGTICNWWSW